MQEMKLETMPPNYMLSLDCHPKNINFLQLVKYYILNFMVRPTTHTDSWSS